MKKALRAPSPALVISLIALFVALGGTSYAAINSLPRNSVGTPQLKNNAVTATKIKNGAVTAAKISASAGLSPVIYAHVLANGTIDTSQSKGITQSMVHLRSTSAFCFSSLPFTPKGGSVTMDYGDPFGSLAEVGQLQISSTANTVDCDTGEPVEVATLSDPSTYAPEAFYVVLYG